MANTHPPETSQFLPVEQLQFLQDLVEQQLGWIDAEHLKKQMWRLLYLALSSELADELDYLERSDLVYMYQKLCDFFDELEALRPFAKR